MKLLILGYGRHGKDTLAEIFRDNFDISFISSSLAACEIAIFPILREKYNYKTIEECYEDRHNHRKEWYEMICEYNKEDGSRLCKDILKLNDCYVGMRSKKEFDASKHLFDLIIFVDASERHPVENSESCTISRKDADIIIMNDSSLKDFEEKANRLGNIIF
jgi:hypothetical protein